MPSRDPVKRGPGDFAGHDLVWIAFFCPGAPHDLQYRTSTYILVGTVLVLPVHMGGAKANYRLALYQIYM